MALSFFIQALVSDPNVKHETIKDGYRFEVKLVDGRKQGVYVREGRKDFEGEELIVVYTVCGTANPKNYENALRLNARISYGAVAIYDIDGKPCFVMTDSILAKNVSSAALRKSVLTLADKGDWLEKQISSEDLR
ncbi:MAG: hypothetical protein HY722_16905 [Planctomycetes bacterium]|nr:hypothetical protein [Planctomycetota bacterium]